VRPGLQLGPRLQDRLLDLLLNAAWRAMRPRRPILKPLATPVPVDPLRSRLAGAADDRGRGRDRHPRTNKHDKPAPLTLAERGTTMQLH
jgi:serine/threonine protein kinase HipA of HipAB toxin-antitoxin module